MEDLEPYEDKFSDSGKRILESSLNEARKRQQNFISPEHILFALIIEESELFESEMRRFSLNPTEIRSGVEKSLEKSRQHIGVGFRIGPESTEIFKFSMDRVRSQGRRAIDAEDIILTFLTVKKDLFDDIWQNFESKIETFKKNRINSNFLQNPQFPKLQEQIEFEAPPMKLWQKFHEEQLKYLSNISWEDVVKNNKFLSQLTSLSGGGGGSGGGGTIGNQINYNHYLSSSFYFKVDTDESFNLSEIIKSLKVEVENRLKLNRLEITKTESQESTFTFEYKGRYLTGKVKFLGQIMGEYFQISLNQDETIVKK